MNQRRYGVVTSELQQEYEDKQKKEATASQTTVHLPDGFNFFRLPKDRNFVKVDILPFIATTENGPMPLSRCNYYIHRNIGPNGVSVICPQNQKGRPCPICEFIRNLSWSDPADAELRKKYREQKRQLYALYWLDAPDDQKNKVLIFDTSEYGFGRILDEKIKKRDSSDPSEANWDKYADPLEGFTLKLNLAEQSYGGPQTYTAVSSIEFKPRIQQYTEDIYDKVPDLTQCLNLLEYDAIKEMFGGKGSETKKPDAYDEDIKTAFDVSAGYNPIVNPSSPISSSAVPVESSAGIEDADAVF